MSLSSKQTCGHCNNIAPMQILGSAEDNDTWGNPAEGSTLDVANIYLILKCPACTKINLITYFGEIIGMKMIKLTISYSTLIIKAFQRAYLMK